MIGSNADVSELRLDRNMESSSFVMVGKAGYMDVNVSKRLDVMEE